jgi:hypothetical protein
MGRPGGPARRCRWFVLLVGLTACAPAAKAPAPNPRLANPDDEADVSLVIEALVVGDPRRGSTDSMLAPSATIVANGETRFGNPRLAGVETGGLAAVTASEVNVRQDVAWAIFDYRWFSEDKTRVHLGRALMVLVPKRGGGGWLVTALESAQSGGTR